MAGGKNFDDGAVEVVNSVLVNSLLLQRSPVHPRIQILSPASLHR